MNKRKTRKWLKAIEKLEEYYFKYPRKSIPVSYGFMFEKICPLCRVVNSNCDKCLWCIFEGEDCVKKEFWEDNAVERVARLTRWEIRLKKEKINE